MAENTLKTRILLKYDTYESWQANDLILKKGEVGVVQITEGDSESGLTPPAVSFKIGDGEKQWSQLPWPQTSAGDVYGWAKTKTKPTYNANEIQGLEEFISGEINDTNTQYQLISEDEGTTYKLQKKDVGEEAWSDVEGSTIDLSKFKVDFSSLVYEDTVTEHQFVTKVSQTDGVVSVERAALQKEDIPTIDIAQVDGLLTKLNEKQDLLQFESPYNAESNKVATKTDIDNALQGLSGALKFKGTQESLPEDTSGYTDGDVIFVQNKEYVCESETWRELGDESSFAVKGSIKNADIAADANIDQSKINGLTDALDTKVDKSGTDRLMKEEEGTKLEGIETGAQVNKIESISVNGQDVVIDETKKATITIDIPSGKLASLDEVSEDELEETLATKINSKADDSALAAIAKSGEVKDLKQTDGTILVLNCGTSAEEAV